MLSRPEFEIELDAIFLAETKYTFGDVETAIRDAIPWILTRIVAARDFNELGQSFLELEPQERRFRAALGCEVLAKASARPDVRRWLCDYLGELRLGEGGCYQLACSYSRLGVEARRARRMPEAIGYARKGLASVADLPPRAITANLYYNLGVALEHADLGRAAIEAFGDSAEIDELIGRPEEAELARQRIKLLQNHVSYETRK